MVYCPGLVFSTECRCQGGGKAARQIHISCDLRRLLCCDQRICCGDEPLHLPHRVPEWDMGINFVYQIDSPHSWMPCSFPSETARQSILYSVDPGLVAIIIRTTQVLVDCPEDFQICRFACIQKSPGLWLLAWLSDGMIQADRVRAHALHHSE